MSEDQLLLVLDKLDVITDNIQDIESLLKILSDISDSLIGIGTFLNDIAVIITAVLVFLIIRLIYWMFSWMF